MSWYLEDGKDSDVVVSSRVRIARNIAGKKFVSTASDEELKDVLMTIKNSNIDSDLHFINLSDLDELMKNSLVEKRVISRDLLEMKETGILLNDAEDISIMINEEDHLRIQVMKPGFNLDEALSDAIKVDEKISSKINYAYNDKYGFLTACPTNLGTGLRASVMLHLPALRLSGKIEKVLEVVNKVNLNVRGVYGEGTEAIGDLYQVSNKISLGVTEEEIVENVKLIVQKLIEQERKAREYLKNQGETFEDRVSRTYGNLLYARKMTYSECAKLISIVRLGISMEIITEIDNEKLNKISILTKPATLQKYLKKELSAEERDIERAKVIKQIIESK
mgnify:FL=1